MRLVFLFATLILALPLPDAPRDETGPVAVICGVVTYILFRAPRRRITVWEAPFVLAAIWAAGYAAYCFEPIAFLAVYTVLAVTFGFAATAVGKKRREQTIWPAWRTFHIELVGPILPPFAFVYYWFRPRN